MLKIDSHLKNLPLFLFQQAADFSFCFEKNDYQFFEFQNFSDHRNLDL